jgi:hypothetical protein
MARRALSSIPVLILAVSLCLALSASPARAYWPTDGRPVGTSGLQQMNPAMVGDGAGGALVFWTDDRSTSTLRLSMHHLLYTGFVDPALPVPGAQFSRIKTSGQGLTAVSDGAGGAIAVWQEQDSASTRQQVHALRVTGAGAVAAGWPDTGATVSAATVGSGASAPVAISDGVGGVIIAWQQTNTAGFGGLDVLVSRLGSSGSRASGWPAGGVLLCGLSANQYAPQIASDGAGGAIVTWLDLRGAAVGEITPIELYAQHVLSNGTVGWTANGVGVSTVANDVSDVALLPDGSGGVFASFSLASGGATNLYAQRLDNLGARQWGTSGVTVCSAAFDQSGSQLATDGSTGAVVTWCDGRSSGSTDIYAQRLNSAGVPQWTANGVLECGATDLQQLPKVVSDGASGAILAWVDFRTSTWDLYAQRINSSGAAQWAANGIPFCLSHNADYTAPITAITDGGGGALVSWLDRRSSTPGIYTARINASGITGPSPVTLGSLEARVAEGVVELSWSAYLSGAAEFQVLRSARADGPFRALDAQVRPAAGASGFRAQDRSAVPGRENFYQIGCRENGVWSYSGVVRVAVPAVAPGLTAVTPTPSRGPVRIDYALAGDRAARLEICDVVGRRVALLADGARGEGRHSAVWDGRLENGAQAAGGIYFARLLFGERMLTRRIVLLR